MTQDPNDEELTRVQRLLTSRVMLSLGLSGAVVGGVSLGFDMPLDLVDSEALVATGMLVAMTGVLLGPSRRKG